MPKRILRRVRSSRKVFWMVVDRLSMAFDVHTAQIGSAPLATMIGAIAFATSVSHNLAAESRKPSFLGNFLHIRRMHCALSIKSNSKPTQGLIGSCALLSSGSLTGLRNLQINISCRRSRSIGRWIDPTYLPAGRWRWVMVACTSYRELSYGE